MKITIIGGSGFVGSNIPETFLRTHTVQNVDLVEPRQSIFTENVIGDFEDLQVIKKIRNFKPDWILVFAGKQYTSPQQPRKKRKDYFQGNIRLAQTIVDYFSEDSSKLNLLFISTDMVYGLPGVDLITEDCTPRPIGDYGQSKLLAEQILTNSFQNLAIIRPRLIVGPGRVGTIKSLASLINRGFPIPIFGDGNNRYQMIGVSDLWHAITLIVSKEAKGLFNVGSDQPPTLNELFEVIKVDLKLSNLVLHINPKLAGVLLEAGDRLGFSPLAREQFALASENCLLSTTRIKSLGWTPTQTDASMMKAALIELLDKNRTSS